VTRCIAGPLAARAPTQATPFLVRVLRAILPCHLTGFGWFSMQAVSASMATRPRAVTTALVRVACVTASTVAGARSATSSPQPVGKRLSLVVVLRHSVVDCPQALLLSVCSFLVRPRAKFPRHRCWRVARVKISIVCQVRQVLVMHARRCSLHDSREHHHLVGWCLRGASRL
jgi:hypothetical protein